MPSFIHDTITERLTGYLDRRAVRPRLAPRQTELLLDWCRGWISGKPLGEPAAAAELGDSSVLLERIQTHGLSGIVNDHLGRCGAAWPLPDGFRKGLEDLDYACRYRNVLLGEANRRALEALEQAGIDAMILKGQSLAEALYPNPLLRPPGDIDLLVRPADSERAEAVLAALGYAPLSEAVRRAYRRTHFHLPLYHGGVTLELHWAPAHQRRFPFDLEDLWKKAGRREFCGGAWSTPAPEDELVYLMHHQAKHFLLERFILLVDLALYLDRFSGEIDWRTLPERAAAQGVRRTVRASLAGLLHFLGDVLPPAGAAGARDALEALGPPAPAMRILEGALLGRRPFDHPLVGEVPFRKAWALFTVDGLPRAVSYALLRREAYRIVK